MSSAYIVPAALLEASPPRGATEWHATAIPADLTQWLLVVTWDNPNEEIAFESLAEVLPLGSPWEPLPDQAAALLASFQPTDAGGSLSAALPSTDVAATPDTVGTALKRLPWPAARLVR